MSNITQIVSQDSHLRNILKKVFKKPAFGLITASVLLGSVFVINTVFATATFTPASGGANISVDTASPAGNGTYTPLGSISIIESAAGDIAIGTHTFTLPADWEFDTSSHITASKT